MSIGYASGTVAQPETEPSKAVRHEHQAVTTPAAPPTISDPPPGRPGDTAAGHAFCKPGARG